MCERHEYPSSDASTMAVVPSSRHDTAKLSTYDTAYSVALRPSLTKAANTRTNLQVPRAFFEKNITLLKMRGLQLLCCGFFLKTAMLLICLGGREASL